jgi:hypothetical protein
MHRLATASRKLPDAVVETMIAVAVIAGGDVVDDQSEFDPSLIKRSSVFVALPV